MRSLPLPNIKTTDFISDIFNFRDPLKIERFENCTGLILLYERLFALKAANNNINLFPSGNKLENYVSKIELIDLYDRKFVQERGRDFYIKLRKSVSKCPSCLLKDVEEIDHYLPKSEYPVLSVTISNLVPICSTCNEVKKAKTFTTALIHPYFDDISNFEWLFLEVIIKGNNMIGFSYYINIPPSIPDSRMKFLKIYNHMSNLNLFEIYNSKASELHSSSVDALKNILESSNKTVVESALIGFYKGATKQTINNYEAAFYKALLKGNYIDDYLTHYAIT